MKDIIIMLSILLTIGFGVHIALSLYEMNDIVYSETECIGETCTNHLIKQMDNKTLNISITNLIEIVINTQ